MARIKASAWGVVGPHRSQFSLCAGVGAGLAYCGCHQISFERRCNRNLTAPNFKHSRLAAHLVPRVLAFCMSELIWLWVPFFSLTPYAPLRADWYRAPGSETCFQ